MSEIERLQKKVQALEARAEKAEKALGSQKGRELQSQLRAALLEHGVAKGAPLNDAIRAVMREAEIQLDDDGDVLSDFKGESFVGANQLARRFVQQFPFYTQADIDRRHREAREHAIEEHRPPPDAMQGLSRDQLLRASNRESLDEHEKVEAIRKREYDRAIARLDRPVHELSVNEQLALDAQVRGRVEEQIKSPR